MDILIYGTDYKVIGIVDTASSIIWANRFRECGDFEIYVPASSEMLELLQIDNMVGRTDDDMVCIIEKIRIETDEENGDYIIATGRDLRSVLDRRVVWEQTILSGTLENGLRRLVTDAFISPTITARQYTNIALATAHGYTDSIRAQYTGKNLLEAIEELCAANNYGFKITLGGSKLMVDFYKANDRSANQTALPWVVFSEEFDNLTTSAYEHDKTAYKTVALIAGEGEGSARRKSTITTGTDLEGLARREMYIDARDISSNEGEITDAEYTELLQERGLTELQEAAVVESMEGTVESRQQYLYKTDYNLGDTVTVRNKYGIQADARVLEVVETWDESGYICTPTFG